MQLYNEQNSLLAKTIDEQASNPDWDCYFDRSKNKWIPYSLHAGECYSKKARIIGNISRGFFNKNSIDKYLIWENPQNSLVGISSLLEALSLAKYFNNLNVNEYLLTLIPIDYQGDIDEMKEKYFNIWKLNNSINITTNEV